LIVFVGQPCTGKTTRCKELHQHLEDHSEYNVVVVSEDTLGITREVGYANSKAEKITRASLKAAVEREISRPNTVVLLDSLNYIKGFRYELFCMAKTAGLSYCLVFCDVSPHIAEEWHRATTTDTWTPEQVKELQMRFERPNDRNRWDKPLFTVGAMEPLPLDDIMSVLKGVTLKPHHSTVPDSIAAGNTLHELDRITQDIIDIILKARPTYVPGDEIRVPVASKPVVLSKGINLARLRRVRRQYLKLSQVAQPTSRADAANGFVHYLCLNA